MLSCSSRSWITPPARHILLVTTEGKDMPTDARAAPTGNPLDRKGRRDVNVFTIAAPFRRFYPNRCRRRSCFSGDGKPGLPHESAPTLLVWCPSRVHTYAVLRRVS